VARSVSIRSQGFVWSGASKVRFLTIRSVLDGLVRGIVGSLTLLPLLSPALLSAQYTETKIGEYLNFAVAATNGSAYAGYNSIGYAGPVVYTSALGWTGLPISAGFNTSLPYYGYTTGISRDGTVISGYAWGTSSTGSSIQYALYWVNGVETVIPPPPDDPSANLMTATAVSGDGTTLLVEDTTGTNGSKVQTFVYDIATQKFTAVGYLGSTVQQSYGTALNYNGSVATGYSNLDNTKIHGFIWTKSSGLKDMGIPHSTTYYVEPTCISDDGTVIFGRHTELNGWLGFRYTTSGGFEEIGGLSPTGCTADGKEAFGIQDLYFPGIWTTTLGGGFLDNLLTAHGIKSTLGDLSAPVTISPDGTLLTAIGIFVYVGDQAWGGTFQIGIPSPLSTTPIPARKVIFSTPYQTTLNVPAPGLVGYSDFSKGATAAVVTRPRHAATFVLKASGAFTYTPMAGFGGRNDYFTYHLINSFGTSVTGTVKIGVGAAP
jgi:hypothetical protein